MLSVQDGLAEKQRSPHLALPGNDVLIKTCAPQLKLPDRVEGSLLRDFGL
ncbi:MAG: hypothetical protein ABL897_11100 [Hyphomicrobium sp.]